MLDINYNIKLTLDQRTVKLSSHVEVQPNTLSPPWKYHRQQSKKHYKKQLYFC